MSTSPAGPETRSCPMCGEEILAVARKCKHCRELLDSSPATAPAGGPEGPGAPPGVDPPSAPSGASPRDPARPPAPPLPPGVAGRPARRASWVVAGVTAAVALGAFAFLWLRPGPEDSIEKARAAYLRHDGPAFDQLVDVPAVLDSVIDGYVDQQLETNHAAFTDGLVAKGLVGLGKTLCLRKVSSYVAQLVVGEKPTDTLLPRDTPLAVAQLVAGLFETVRSTLDAQVSYGGVVSKAVSADAARVGIRVDVGNRPLIVKLQLRRVAGAWRVVALAEVGQLVEQVRRLSHGPAVQPANGAGAGSAVVARGVGFTITAGDLRAHVEDLAPEVRASFTDPDRKRELLAGVIRFELLALAAEREGLAGAPEVQANLEKVGASKGGPGIGQDARLARKKAMVSGYLQRYFRGQGEAGVPGGDREKRAKEFDDLVYRFYLDADVRVDDEELQKVTVSAN